jgi:glycosyltransferase involved in cell wall biosynthesis
MSKVILDCQHLKLYPVGKPGPAGGTELMVHVLARGLVAGGHTVHVVTPDLDEEEERGERLTYWPPAYHPTRGDVVVMVGSLAGAEHYAGDALVYATNGVELPDRLIPETADLVAAWPVFSRKHGELLCRVNPTIKPERIVVTGLGVDAEDYIFEAGSRAVPDLRSYAPSIVRDERGEGGFERMMRAADEAAVRAYKVPGRVWVGNDPARGLVHVLDVFDLVRERVPEATLHVTYDFDQQFERMKWHQNALAETLWECRRRLDTTPGVTLLGAVSRGQVIREQLEAQVHLWPSDPPNLGSQIHGISQMEAAAAGCALVLSDVEAFPEVFGGVADILPTIGTFMPDPEGEDGRRVDARDYADVVVALMTDPDLWAKASRDSRALAEQHTWSAVVERWLAMLEMLSGVPV